MKKIITAIAVGCFLTAGVTAQNTKRSNNLNTHQDTVRNNTQLHNGTRNTHRSNQRDSYYNNRDTTYRNSRTSTDSMNRSNRNDYNNTK